MNRTIGSTSTTAILARRIEDESLLASTQRTNAVRIWQMVLDAWVAGDIDEVLRQFADEFTFIDHALGLEFKEKDRLHEFLVKIRELYSDSERIDHTLFSDGDCIISEWTFTATQDEPFLNGRFRKVKISARGVSVVQVRDGRIVKWSEYYDQLMSRRYRLVGSFTDWGEI